MDAITSCFNCKKSAVVPEMTTLSPEQISMIQTTWSIPAQSPIDSGEAILLAFFEKYPNNQQKFASFKNIPLLSLKVRMISLSWTKRDSLKNFNFLRLRLNNTCVLQGTPGFRTHAGRVITVFNDSVICLDKEDHLAELEALWTKIGESHNKRKISQQAFNVSICDLNIFNQIGQDGSLVSYTLYFYPNWLEPFSFYCSKC